MRKSKNQKQFGTHALLILMKHMPGVLTYEQTLKTNCVFMDTVTNTVKLFFEGGFERIIILNRNVNSDSTWCKFDGRAKARIIEITCGRSSEG